MKSGDACPLCAKGTIEDLRGRLWIEEGRAVNVVEVL